jgi:hypothetical protein
VSPYFTNAVDECVRDLERRRDECARDLLRERAELVAEINAKLDRVEAIDTMVCGFRAVWPHVAAGCADGGPAPVRVGGRGLVAVGA